METNEKLLLWDNIIYKKSRFIKKSETIGNYIYPCIFNKYTNNNTINVTVNSNINDICKEGDNINTDLNCCISVPDFCYDYFIKILKNNSNLDECRDLCQGYSSCD